MQQPFPDSYNEIADSMSIALYQRMSLNDASLFLRCPSSELEKLIASKKLNCIKMNNSETQFFGYQLLEYILGNVTHHKTPAIPSNLPERILRIQEVIGMTGLSRTTLWRMEKTGDFPARVSLGANSIGWRHTQIQSWIDNKQ